MSDSEIQRTKASNAVTQIRKQQEGELASSSALLPRLNSCIRSDIAAYRFLGIQEPHLHEPTHHSDRLPRLPPSPFRLHQTSARTSSRPSHRRFEASKPSTPRTPFLPPESRRCVHSHRHLPPCSTRTSYPFDLRHARPLCR